MASYVVSKRLRELGIRVALAHRNGKLLNASLGRAFRCSPFGSVAGLGLESWQLVCCRSSSTSHAERSAGVAWVSVTMLLLVWWRLDSSPSRTGRGSADL